MDADSTRSGLKAIKHSLRQWRLNHPHRDPRLVFEPGAARLLTSPFRKLPDFLIIGGQKCGTTSLYIYLCRHPQVASAAKKEPLYFDTMHSLGSLWYRAFFPSRFERPERITGDASVHSMPHPRAPARAFRLVPDAKILITLRNPVDRAYSHYQMSRRNLQETLSFEDAIEAEGDRLETELKLIAEKRNYYSHSFIFHSYLLRGVYVEQISRWMNVYPREQFMILDSDALAEQTLETMDRVYGFMGLHPFDTLKIKKANVRSYPAMAPETRRYLIDYFRPHNARLNEALGTRFAWDA